MADRYFVESPIEGDRVVLTGQEAHHLAHVMRQRPGDNVTVFDGNGAEFSACIQQVDRDQVTVTIESRSDVSRELSRPLTLGVALPKGDRGRWLVEKLTELGVARMVPLLLERSVAVTGEKSLRRLRRAVIEASKQCGRNRLMEIAAPSRWTDYLAAADGPRFIAHLQGRPISELLITADDGLIAYAAIGPEGGFTEDEVSQAVQSGWHAVCLGRRTLRTETAAMALAALLGRDAG